MTLISKFAVWAVLSLLAAVGAKAGDIRADDIKASNALICGTADEASHFMKLHDDLQRALVGASEAGSGGKCLAALIAYIPGKVMERVAHKDATYAVTEILIVGVGTPYGMLAAKPSIAYTVLKVDEEAA